MVPLIYPGSEAKEFVTLATIGPRPTKSSAGKEISDPPPAIELTVPATKPAATKNKRCAIFN